MAFLAAILLPSGCSTLSDVGYGAAIPFAAIGDTVIAPFQGIGCGYEPLFELGDAHREAVYEEDKGKVTLPLDELTSLVYYIPGVVCWPFHVLTPSEWYPMTRSCVAHFEDDAASHAPDARRAVDPDHERVPPRYVPDHPSYNEFREF